MVLCKERAPASNTTGPHFCVLYSAGISGNSTLSKVQSSPVTFTTEAFFSVAYLPTLLFPIFLPVWFEQSSRVSVDVAVVVPLSLSKTNEKSKIKLKASLIEADSFCSLARPIINLQPDRELSLVQYTIYIFHMQAAYWRCLPWQRDFFTQGFMLMFSAPYLLCCLL